HMFVDKRSEGRLSVKRITVGQVFWPRTRLGSPIWLYGLPIGSFRCDPSEGPVTRRRRPSDSLSTFGHAKAFVTERHVAGPSPRAGATSRTQAGCPGGAGPPAGHYPRTAAGTGDRRSFPTVD